MKRLLAFVMLSGCLSQPGPPAGSAHVWRELPQASEPGALDAPRMTWDASRHAVVLHGGIDGDGASTKTWKLGPSGWEEICLPSTAPAVYSPAFGYDPNGQQLVLIGGSTAADFTSPTANVFTCSSTVSGATWVPQATAVPLALAGSQLVYDEERGQLILIGGSDAAGDYARESYVTQDLLSWAPLGQASPSTFGGVATTITYDMHERRILALKNYTNTSPQASNELWQLPKSGGWSLICGPNMRGCQWDARSDAALVHLGDSESTIAIGGSSGTRRELAGSWVLDHGELVQFDNDPPARDGAAVAYDPETKQAVLYGGKGAGCTGAGNNCSTTWVLE